MNFRLRGRDTVILMSVRRGAPYEDRIEQEGRVIVYEGHDVPKSRNGPDAKSLDQSEFQPNGRRTQNGLFMEAVRQFTSGRAEAEQVHVFEKMRDGIWVYNGVFRLIDGWHETNERRQVFKFKLELVDEAKHEPQPCSRVVEHDRIIPTSVKREVWTRDKGSCVMCGSKKNLHFDHIIPYSQGGSSKDASNIQILCGSHNLQKHDNIE